MKRHKLDLGEDSEEEEKPVTGQTFTPHAIQSVWTDPDSTINCLSVAILLPSGVRPKDVLTTRVLEGGRELEITILWPKPFYDMKTLHKKWITPSTSGGAQSCTSMQTYHPKFLGFELFLKPFRKRAHDPIEAVGRVGLKIAVQAHIFDRTHLGWLDSAARVLYVDLKAPANKYGPLKNDKEEAELC